MLRVTKSARGFALVARRHAARWGPGGARGCASVSFDWPMDIRAILDDLNAHRKVRAAPPRLEPDIGLMDLVPRRCGDGDRVGPAPAPRA